jgi:hypothetical protein
MNILYRVELLLCNDRKISKYTRVNSNQRLGKQVPVVTDTHATIKVLLEMMSSTRSVPRIYKEDRGIKDNTFRESLKIFQFEGSRLSERT